MSESKRFSSAFLNKPHAWSLAAFVAILGAGFVAYWTQSDASAPEQTAVDIPQIKTAIPELPPPEGPATTVKKLGVRPPPAPDPTITGSIQSQNSGAKRTFVRHDNRDLFGGDYYRVGSTTESECENRCGADRRCRAYTFNKWVGTCFLKSSIGSLRMEPQGTTGILASLTARLDQRPPSIQKTRGRRIPGTAYKTLPARSFEACTAVCLNEAECLGFNFSRPERSCALMSSVALPSRAKVTDIGLKVQRSPSSRRLPPVGVRPFPRRDVPPGFGPVFDLMLGGVVRL